LVDPVIQIYDANAFLRRSLNQFDMVGLNPRQIYQEALQSQVPQIWVWDGPGNNDRRRALFPGYKIRDYTGQENIFAGLQIYRDVLSHSTAVQIEVPGWEADDVCATLAKRYAPVTIHTNDFDYWQLADNPLITLKGVRPNPDVPPSYVPLYKALRGDPSDKIPGLPGFGPKAWLAMRGIYDVLDEALRTRNADLFRAQPFTTKPKLWLSSDENFELLCVYYDITRMLDVPLEEIDQHTRAGVPNPAAAEQLFARFML
jgi:5'-3' exonuclease